ncbi:tRNA preQ1(34) S-adenosylmethionine ribosyltransferase-isomerase QueA, partial [Trichloromonas sp.]|uniref:tRNA preQ1(34) S-adenosylmethionine ribosyltransferase-isomerase QueA n=1 Tax=Trichloromonas sp. TaxID=3069249 RepID=UPI003D812930
DFDFELPEALIAQYPPESREDSRLMVLKRREQTIDAGAFRDILDCFVSGDLLVLNDTRVIPARLLGEKESGGRIEVFLVRRLASNDEDWACLTRCSKTPKPGARLLLGGEIEAIVLPGGEAPYRHIRFQCRGDFTEALERVGRIPLPPYIRREDDQVDRDRYQTVFAKANGAVAAPTAGLHFTERVLDELRAKGVMICPVTLHVGLGTFLPVRAENILEHRMHSEAFHIPRSTADAVNQAKAQGRRVFALGTTTTRTLEYAVDEQGRLEAGEGSSDLFIYPGFRFRIVDAMITNFHLPKSTLLMLVSAFAGRDFVLEAYRRAVREHFRFFSYGDCMLIL